MSILGQVMKLPFKETVLLLVIPLILLLVIVLFPAVYSSPVRLPERIARESGFTTGVVSSCRFGLNEWLIIRTLECVACLGKLDPR